MSLESSEEAMVLADELEECGDPRAELVRAQLTGREHGELLRKHWSQWVGTLEEGSSLLRWKWGHLVELGVRGAPVGWTPEELLRKPTTDSSRGSPWGRRFRAAAWSTLQRCVTSFALGTSSHGRS